MSKQPDSQKYWLDRQFKYLQDNFEKLETKITIVFTVSTITFPLFFGILASAKEDNPLNDLWGFLMGISLWAMIISGVLLYRNSERTGVNRKLTNIENKLDKLDLIATKLDTLIDEIRKDRNERNNSNK
jgi:hypothetical protein